MSELIFKQNPRLQSLARRLLDARRAGELLLQAGDVGWASAPSNIALLKYWGKKAGLQQIPVNSSLSLTLDGFRAFTRLSVVGRFFPLQENSVPTILERPAFSLRLNGVSSVLPAKMELFLKSILHGFADDISLEVESLNNFPTACGVASSAAGYAALVGALADVLQLKRFLSEEELCFWMCEWSRLGSGSATRSAFLPSSSLPPRFVGWELAGDGMSSATRVIKAHAKFSELEHCVLLLDAGEKAVGSSEGHLLAQTSLFQEIRLAHYPQRYDAACAALREGDFQRLQELSELDAFEMHAVMATGANPLHYMTRATASAIAQFVAFRDACRAPMLWTLDAGANPHFIFQRDSKSLLADFFQQLAPQELFSEAQVLQARGPSAGVLLGEASGAKKMLSAQGSDVSAQGSDVQMQTLSLSQAAESFRKGERP